ncbi:unnamed protein product [Chrysoparadoxa australica]
MSRRPSQNGGRSLDEPGGEGPRIRQGGGRFVRWAAELSQKREQSVRENAGGGYCTDRDFLARWCRQGKGLLAFGLLALASLGAVMIAVCFYVVVRPWSRAYYRRMLCCVVAAPLMDAAVLLLPRTRVSITTGDSGMLDGLCPGVIVSNKLPGPSAALEWWSLLLLARTVGAHGHMKLLATDQLRLVPVLGWLLQLLECPPLRTCFQDGREELAELLASFATDSISSGVPYLFLQFPEGNEFHRESVASSLEFARKEGRPELQRLLLPHTPAFTACINGLGACFPVVYDVTIAAAGYNGRVPENPTSNLAVVEELMTGEAIIDQHGLGGWSRGDHEVHIQIKRYTMEEVMGNAHWLDDRWREKERMLDHFARHQCFQTETRGARSLRTLDTRTQQFRGSPLALIRLLVVPFMLPVLMMAFTPLVIFLSSTAMICRAAWSALSRIFGLTLPAGWQAALLGRGGMDDDDDQSEPLSAGRNTPWWFAPRTPLPTPSNPHLGSNGHLGNNASLR